MNKNKRKGINSKIIKEFIDAWNNGSLDVGSIKDMEKAEKTFVKNVKDIIKSFDVKTSETKEVKRVGNAIADEILKVRWLTWTFFPFLFRNCHSDSELNSTIDDLNYFCTKCGIFTKGNKDD